MYAIVEISGKQYKVEKDATINVDRLENKENENMTIDKVLLFADGENVLIGEPYLSNVKVQATVLGEVKGKKVRLDKQTCRLTLFLGLSRMMVS